MAASTKIGFKSKIQSPLLGDNSITSSPGVKSVDGDLLVPKGENIEIIVEGFRFVLTHEEDGTVRLKSWMQNLLG